MAEGGARVRAASRWEARGSGGGRMRGADRRSRPSDG